MGTPVPFRINGGLALGKDGPEFHLIDTAPVGGDSLTDSLALGSLCIARDTGKFFRKTTAGVGSDKWTAVGSAAENTGSVHWKHPVRLADTRAMSTAEFLTEINAYGMLDGYSIRNFNGGADFVEMSAPGGNINDASVLLAANTDQEGRYIVSEGWARLDISGGGNDVVLMSRLSGTAGNAITLALLNTAGNVTTTTATIVGNAITVTLKDDGTNPTSNVSEILAAIEAADTNNLVTAVYNSKFIEGAIFGYVPGAMAATNFAGGGTGDSGVASASGSFGTPNSNEVEVGLNYSGSGWNTLTIVTTHNNWDGRATPLAVIDFTTKTFTINLANNGVSVITTTIADLQDILGSQEPTMVDEQGRMLYGSFLYMNVGSGSTGTNPVPIYSGQPLSGGTDYDYDIMPAWGQNNATGWRPDEGDTVYVERGQNWGSLFIYNDDGVWVKQGAADGQEASFISAYIGKLAVGNGMPTYTTQNVVAGGTSLTAAISALDARLGDNLKESKSAAVTTATTVDAIVMEQNLAVNWMIHVREVANPQNIYTVNVFASHDANTGLAATRADYNEAGILQFGNDIDGLDINVDVETSGALSARLMRLRIASTDSVDVTVQKNPLRRV